MLPSEPLQRLNNEIVLTAPKITNLHSLKDNMTYW